MSEKQHILVSIVKIAKQLGRPPSLSEFTAAAGISKSRASRFFPCWNHAVRAAGLDPHPLTVRLQNSELLKAWGEIVRKNRSIPSRHTFAREGKYDWRTLERRFGTWSSLPRVFRNFAKGKPEWADVLALLSASRPRQKRFRPNGNPPPASKVPHSPSPNRATYGNPLDFRGLRHEPVNAQGVVLLFGMVAKELGYMIEAVQKGFPDCEAKRQIAPDRWQRVNIEFEFESRNFRDHGHPLTGCDVIVCWRHNWDDCPEHIEVLELSSVTKELRTGSA